MTGMDKKKRTHPASPGLLLLFFWYLVKAGTEEPGNYFRWLRQVPHSHAGILRWTKAGGIMASGGKGIGFRGSGEKGMWRILCVVPSWFFNVRGKTCKSNSNNQRKCRDIKYSIVRGSMVKPTGLTMYSPGYTKDLDSDNRQMLQADPRCDIFLHSISFTFNKVCYRFCNQILQHEV